MARVSIFYDEDLKEQFFMVRGDERYARATKTILEVGASTPNLYDFDLSVTVNVLRDEDEGTIVIYDNNDPVFIIDDWDSSDNARTIVLEHMAYDIDHILTAEYRGNNKCSPSLSNATTVNIHDTNRVTSILTISSGTQYDPNTSITKTLTLTNSASNPLYNQGQEIDIYYDDIYVSTVTTSEEGTVDFTVNNGDNGLHIIKAEYVGSEHLTAETTTQEISVGYKVNATTYDNVVISGRDNYFTARVTNFLGTPVSNTLTYVVGDGFASYITDPQYTDNNGYVTFTGFTQMGAIYFYTDINNRRYRSESYPIYNYIPTSIDVSSSSPQLYKGEENLLTIIVKGRSINSNIPPKLPITLTGDITDTVYTETMVLTEDSLGIKYSTGTASKSIQGTGKLTKSITANIGEVSKNITLNDYLQYWQPNAPPHNRKYFTGGGTFMDLNNLYRITASNVFVFTLPMEDNKDYEFIIEGLSSTKNAYVGFVSNTIGNENGVTVSGFTPPSTFVAHSNETWKMVRENGTVTVYKNNTVVNTYSNQGTYHPAFLYMANNTSTNFDFTKLTLREL